MILLIIYAITFTLYSLKNKLHRVISRIEIHVLLWLLFNKIEDLHVLMDFSTHIKTGYMISSWLPLLVLDSVG